MWLAHHHTAHGQRAPTVTRRRDRVRPPRANPRADDSARRRAFSVVASNARVMHGPFSRSASWCAGYTNVISFRRSGQPRWSRSVVITRARLRPEARRSSQSARLACGTRGAEPGGASEIGLSIGQRRADTWAGCRHPTLIAGLPGRSPPQTRRALPGRPGRQIVRTRANHPCGGGAAWRCHGQRTKRANPNDSSTCGDPPIRRGRHCMLYSPRRPSSWSGDRRTRPSSRPCRSGPPPSTPSSVGRT